MNRRLGLLLALAAAALFAPPRIAAQAFTAPKGLGSVTLSLQYVDNTGHRLTDGTLLKAGESVTTSALIEADYGITDRFSASVGIPFVFAKYTGGMPPFSGLPRDFCACWHSGFQDFSLSARYRFGDETRALTPSVRYILPSHDYPYEGEAVVGRNLEEIQVGLNAGMRLSGILRRASIETGYAYSFVDKPIRDVSIDRSNAFASAGYALTDRLHVHGVASWQETHGGLSFGSPTGKPFFPPGEFTTPERYAQRDRLIASRFWQAGGGLAYAVGQVDVFLSVIKYLSGRDAHDGQAYTVGATWYFDLSD